MGYGRIKRIRYDTRVVVVEVQLRLLEQLGSSFQGPSPYPLAGALDSDGWKVAGMVFASRKKEKLICGNGKLGTAPLVRKQMYVLKRNGWMNGVSSCLQRCLKHEWI